LAQLSSSPFTRVVAGIDRTPEAVEAAPQATVIAHPTSLRMREAVDLRDTQTSPDEARLMQLRCRALGGEWRRRESNPRKISRGIAARRRSGREARSPSRESELAAGTGKAAGPYAENGEWSGATHPSS
jgi:hypothetical protein